MMTTLFRRRAHRDRWTLLRSGSRWRRWTFIAIVLIGLGSSMGLGFVVSNPNARWPYGEIKFRTLLGDAGRTLTDGHTSWDNVVIDAASLWNQDLQPVRLAVAPATGSPGSRDGVSQVAWSDTVYGQSFGGALAVAITWSSGSRIVESDILVDEARQWDSFRGTLSGHGFVNDLRRVVAHEFGHSLGLNHPDEDGQNVDAVMNSIASDIDAPVADDVAGIQYLFPPETTKPGVTITSPANGARIFGDTVLVTGTASDNALTESVRYQLNGATATDADTTNVAPTIRWSAHLSLSPGSNTIAVYSIDTSGNSSSTSSRTLFRVVSNAVQILTAGSGTVSPDLHGLGLEIGRKYTVTAIPSAGHVFSNWSGAIDAAAPRLTFLMESNLVLQANFVLNPFLETAGTFNGLCLETNVPRHETSGSLSLKLTSKGTYSGKLSLAGRSHSVSGSFDLSGRTTNTIRRGGTNLPLGLSLQLGINSDEPNRLSGEVTDGNWISVLHANRSVFNAATAPAPLAGLYTCIITGTNDPVAGPAGDSYAAGKIDGAGNIKLTGKLADGTKLALKSVVSSAHEWPLYASLYSGKGSIAGWMTATNNSLVPWGMVHWFKPATTKGFHTAGLTNFAMMLGSPFVQPATKTNRVVNISNGLATFSAGNLGTPVDYYFTLNPDNKVTSTNAGFTWTINTASGLFKGTFLHPDTQRKTTFNGAIRQNADEASGWFPGTNESGWVILRAVP